MSDNTDIQLIETALVEFSKVEAGLQELRKQYSGVVFAVGTTKGMDDAKAARLTLREPRYEIERVRKAAKAPILAIGKKLDADAARITAEIEKLEGPIDAQIKAEEARKEAEKQAKIAAEQKRVADIKERIEELRGCQMLTPASGSRLISEHISDLEKLPVDDSFDEFRQQADDAKTAGLARLNALLDAAVAHENEQARIKAEREELDRLRAEQAKRDAEERAKLAAEAEAQRKAQAARDAAAAAELSKQREAMAAEQAKQRKAAEAENAKLAAERAEVEKQRAENERIAKERADAERKQQEQERAAKERAAAAKKKRPTDAEIIKVVAAHFGVDAGVAAGWLAAMRSEAA